MSEATAQVWKDRYEIERPLGRGGMSAVYLAKDRQLLSKRVVVKVLLEEMNEDPWMRQKFFQEMEALARIDHPGVVGVLDTGQTPEGKQFLVMQYIEGKTLRSVIEPGGMPLSLAASLIRQIGQALGAAHEAGVWHRDLKPENVMLQRSGGEDYAKLIDFGIAGIQNSQFSGEKTKVAGSLSYMAPEQFAGNPCAASDTYALGVLAYELLTGEPPFGSSSMTHLVAEDLTVTLPRTRRPDVPEAAERALMKALSFRPEARQASVREFSEELYNALCAASEPTRRTIEEPTRRTTAPEPGALEMAHVLFMDLVGYSLLPMDKQKQHLGELQAIVRAAPRFRASDRSGDIITLPTGDGMALVFFGDPTAPAQCAIEIAAGLKGKPHLKLRMGIHTGPVYRVADVNANANVSGGGINIAQRVMDCGDAGHILVSNTVADVLMQLSDWAPCLCDLGEYPVKHGVKLHIYNLATVDAGNPERPTKLAAAGHEGAAEEVEGADRGGRGGGVARRRGGGMVRDAAQTRGSRAGAARETAAGRVQDASSGKSDCVRGDHARRRLSVHPQLWRRCREVDFQPVGPAPQQHCEAERRRDAAHSTGAGLVRSEHRDREELPVHCLVARRGARSGEAEKAAAGFSRGGDGRRSGAGRGNPKVPERPSQQGLDQRWRDRCRDRRAGAGAWNLAGEAVMVPLRNPIEGAERSYE